MQKAILLSALMLFGGNLMGQALESQKLKFNTWRKDKVITFASVNEGSIIEMAAKGTKLKKSRPRIKPVRINGQNYQLMSNGRAMRLATIDGETLIKTSRDGSMIFIQDEKFTRHRRGNKVIYRDTSGNIVVSGFLKNNVAKMDYELSKERLFLMTICGEELLRRAKENHEATPIFLCP